MVIMVKMSSEIMKEKNDIMIINRDSSNSSNAHITINLIINAMFYSIRLKLSKKSVERIKKNFAKRQ